MSRTRVGIIGCGVIAQTHVQSLCDFDDAELMAVADIREEAARSMAAKFNVTKYYTDADDLLRDDEIEGVILALPAAQRTPLALAAFRAHKHVLTEKPVAMNAQEVQQLIEARGGLIAGCCSSRYRFTETARRASELLASNALGPLRHIQCRVTTPAGPPVANMPPAWRLSRALNGGGILMNWGCYDLDFLLGILGWSLVPDKVLGFTYGVPPQFAARLPDGSDAETHAVALVTFRDGITLSYERAEMYPGSPQATWEISGERGSLQLSMTPSETGRQLVHEHALLDGGLEETVLWQGPDDASAVLHGPARDFVTAIRRGRQPLTNLEQALVVSQISDAIYASAASGEAIKIAS